MSEQPLRGAHALVTGAGRGIGRGCAMALAAAGASLTLTARSSDELEAAVAEIAAAGGRAWAFPADATDEQQVEAAVAVAAGHGDLSIAVHAAGTNRTGPTVDYALADFDFVLSANLRSTFLVCRAVGRHLLARGSGGRIVNISSQMGTVGYPGRAAYCASKHAVDGLTKALAVEWASEEITVNAVAPTFIRTPLTESMFENEEFAADVLQRLPIGRIGEVAEVTGAVVFLVSPAASLITGHILRVYGGWTAW